ncbi:MULTISPECIES: ATP-dependent Clp protease adaptor ClpS [unclassified Butyrivibrio]|jgi:ATP-dependent Clp protease adaptor protein ClpS|uniref:ATP-dependent Clp protease adaptor ClpS n=1 Tax=unclassified Butyrivibrio TaxID=2639466 RepID=UPI000407637C|nr:MULTISPECIES: ATP-dependent Clp protease adaptor ClpS [unclassified Butyrivibrio]
MATQGATKEKTKDLIKEPRQFNVLMFNDDFTTMEFVVEVLVDIFHKDEVTAQSIMMNVHKNGQAVVGKYPYDIARTKVDTALARARNEGFPFRMSVEEA